MVYQHLGPLPDSWSDDDYIHLASVNAVRDRYHLSEIAYSVSLQSRDCKIKEPKILHATLLLKYYAFTIIITAEPAIIRDRYAASKDEIFTIDEVLRVNDTFKLMTHYADYKLHVTSDRPDITDDTVAKICELYNRRRTCVTAWSDTMRNLKL
jgi:hypothetical protein